MSQQTELQGRIEALRRSRASLEEGQSFARKRWKLAIEGSEADQAREEGKGGDRAARPGNICARGAAAGGHCLRPLNRGSLVCSQWQDRCLTVLATTVGLSNPMCSRTRAGMAGGRSDGYRRIKTQPPTSTQILDLAWPQPGLLLY